MSPIFKVYFLNSTLYRKKRKYKLSIHLLVNLFWQIPLKFYNYIAFLSACQLVQSQFVTDFLSKYFLKLVKTSSVHEWDYQDDSYPSLASDPCCFQVSLPSTSWEPTMLKFHFFLSQDITMVQKSKKKLGSAVCAC